MTDDTARSRSGWWAAFGAGTVAGTAIRCLGRRSGVTDDEYFGSLPGDDVIPHPMIEWTRGGTIKAAPERVWPWLVQMGHRRGGWYTSEWFDRMVWGVENPSSDVLLPEWQGLEAGDIVPDGPGYAAYFRVREVRPHEAIVYHSIRHPYRGRPVDPEDAEALARRERELVDGGTDIDFTWVFALRPTDGATRLPIRTRADLSPRLARIAETPLGLVHLFHVTTILRGVRRRVTDAAEEVDR